MKDLCSALAHIHANDIIHRDIKPSNCLLYHAAGQRKFLKVTDFGSSALLTKEDTDPKTRVSVSGTERVLTRQLRQDLTTYRYAAPEMIKRESYNFVADVWSAGVIL